ncbi:MAG: hypothetical protein Q7U89_07680 [Coriobacteriia bacterium]|nr:hypothetical protein [Coriobacteriia bacterium]
MSDAGRAAEWDELRKIDYFLEHLARAVERAEVPRDSYALLAPRYLERRAELASIIERGSARPETVQVARVPESRPAFVLAAIPARMETPRPAPRPVPWTTILTITGAFLVIVATAIFAVATWDMFGVEFKLVFLGGLTAAFYGAGHLVRKRLGLAAGGVALAAVGSAMLLFDGWIAIDGYAIAGSWPWVFWLAVCSLVYWYSETAIGGSFFGVIGASAQVAWVWLLGEGLAWPAPQRLAGMALVAVLWAIAARNAANRPPFASLATTLRWAAGVLVAGSAAGLLIDLAIGPATWAVVLSALVIGLAATVVFEALRLHPGIAAAAHIPVFFALASMTVATGAQWGHVAILAAMVLGYLFYELLRGGWGHGALAIVAELSSTLVLAQLLDWAPDVTLAVVAFVAASWIAASLFLNREDVAPLNMPGVFPMRLMAEIGGWAVLAAATLTMPFVREVIPLSGVLVTARDSALPVWLMVLWALSGAIRKRPVAGLVTLGLSLWAAAALMAWRLPQLQGALYAIGLLAVLAMWLIGRRIARTVWSLSEEFVLIVARLLSAPILFGGLVAQAHYFDIIAWQSALLLALAASWWLVDALTAEESRSGLGVASSLLVLAAAMQAEWAIPGVLPVGWVGPATALALVAVAWPFRGEIGMATYWAWGAGSAALAICVAAPGATSGVFASTFALTAAAWLAIASLGKRPELAALAGVLGFVALFGVADHLKLGPWAWIGLVSICAYLLLATLFIPGSLLSARWTDSLAFSGLLGMLMLCLAALTGPDIAAFGVAPSWAGTSGHELAAALGLLGVFVLVAGVVRSISFAPYIGVALVLLAYLAEIDTLDVGTVEWLTTPLASYIMWAGWYARRGVPGRGTPLPDVLAIIVGLGVPAMLAANPLAQNSPWVHLLWTVGLALVAIGAGVTYKVRGYFLGGVVAIVFVSVVRSWLYLVSFWWLVLGIIGVTMLVVALTWERQQSMVANAQQRVRQALVDWR